MSKNTSLSLTNPKHNNPETDPPDDVNLDDLIASTLAEVDQEDEKEEKAAMLFAHKFTNALYRDRNSFNDNSDSNNNKINAARKLESSCSLPIRFRHTLPNSVNHYASKNENMKSKNDENNINNVSKMRRSYSNHQSHHYRKTNKKPTHKHHNKPKNKNKTNNINNDKQDKPLRFGSPYPPSSSAFFQLTPLPQMSPSPVEVNTISESVNDSKKRKKQKLKMAAISRLTKVLYQMDDDGDGYLDFPEFNEAMDDVLNGNMMDHELQSIFKIMTSNCDKSELKIKKFIKRVQKYNKSSHHQRSISDTSMFIIKSNNNHSSHSHHHTHSKHSNNKKKHQMHHQCPLYHKRQNSVSGALSLSQSRSQSSSSALSSCIKKLLIKAFSSVFDVENREHNPENPPLWMSSLKRVHKELMDESENEKTLDFPEFAASMNNIGIECDKRRLNELYEYFVDKQVTSELNIELFIQDMSYLVQNHELLQPKQIIDLAFGQILLKRLNHDTNRKLKKRRRTLTLQRRRYSAGLNNYNNNNPYMDESLIDPRLLEIKKNDK